MNPIFSKQSRFVLTSVFCVFLISALGLIQHNAGPKISSVSYDNQRFVTELRLGINTRIKPQELVVTISPNVTFSTLHTEREIILRFTEPLVSDTTYSIDVTGIEDSRGKKNDLRHLFRTPPSAYTYLQRQYPNDDDMILTKQINQDPQILYKSEKIYAFAHGRDSLVVIDGADQQLTARLITPKKQVLAFENTGQIKNIFGSRSGDVFVLTYDSLTHTNQTVSYMYNAITGSAQQLNRNDNTPIQINDAVIAADGETIIYQDITDFMLYVDSLFDNQPPLPILSVSRFIRYFPDNSGIIVEKLERNPGLFTFIDTFSGDTQEYDLGLQNLSTTITMSQVPFGIFIDFQNGNGIKHSIVRYDTAPKTIYNPDTDQRFHALQLSTNDEFLSVESSLNPVIYDRYTINSQPQNSFITIVDVDGALIESVPGSNVQWH